VTGRAARTITLVLVVVTVVLVDALPTGAATERWPPLPAFDTTITWSDCGAGWECGTLTVPVDWNAPRGETVGLALARLPAHSPEQRIGALLVNPGGPGFGGTGFVRALAARLPAMVGDRFDLVSWDPRGTGTSRPVDCVDDGFLDFGAAVPAIPDTAEALGVARRYNRALARGCVERNGTYAGQVGTRNSARDLEAIRVALGEPSLNYLGYSYGTVLGATYAQMFPGHIRTMVLDGAPDYWLAPLDFAYTQAQGFMRALEAFLSWCDDDTTCALQDAGTPREVFQALLDRVNAAPIDADYTVNDRTRRGALTASSLETAVISMLYDRARGWPTLARALRAGATGDAGPLLALADSYLGRRPDGTWTSVVEANAVITCVDRPDPKPRSAARELADVARFQSELPPWGGSWAVSGCAGMPRAARGDALGDVHVTGAAPVLVVGTTGDPATPYAGATAMVGRIAGSRLLTYDSTEHTAYGTGRSVCVDDAVDAYLVDQALPSAGARCAPG
jgi:pimeloyl-ACP methyl ester carboxylesterase